MVSRCVLVNTVSGSDARNVLRHLEIDHLVLQPFSESCNTIVQVASRLVPRICNGNDIYLRQRMTDQRTEVFWKRSKGIIATLKPGESRFRHGWGVLRISSTTYFEAVDEDQ